jgi:hypothetical protein
MGRRGERLVKDVFSNFPKTYDAGEMPFYCEICSKPCSEPGGYVVMEAAASVRYCVCCISMLVTTAPDIARSALAALDAKTATTA